MLVVWFLEPRKLGWQNLWGNKEPAKLVYCKADDDETSQHLLDPYSLDHLTAGMMQYIVIPPGGPLTKLAGMRQRSNLQRVLWWFVINLVVHVLWEFVENTPCVIYYLRSSAVDPAYIGDSVINSISDLILAMAGYWLSYLLWDLADMWYLLLLAVLLVQMVSAYLGSGFLLVTKRMVVAAFCKDDDAAEA